MKMKQSGRIGIMIAKVARLVDELLLGNGAPVG
jgi:hypothetical protein